MPPDNMDLDGALNADGGEGGEKEPEKKKSKLMLIIILVVGMAVLGAGGFFGWRMFFAEEKKPPEAAAKAAGEEGKKPEGEKGKDDKGEAAGKPGTVINLEPFIVNLADPSGKRYLKLSLAVDAKNEKLKLELEARKPQIRDSILILLTSKTYNDIAPVAGKIRLRNEVLKIINRFLGGVGSVHAVYFTEFVVQ